jgi:homogentisate 1,2-dioxygenase
MGDDFGVEYQSGFGNEHATEAEPGVLPIGRNSPQRVAHDLYTEQLTGSAFTAPRAEAYRTWMYRMRPSVRHVTGLVDIDPGNIRTSPCREGSPPVAQLRWSPVGVGDEPRTWLEGLSTMAANGDAHLGRGAATHLYFANRSMEDEVFADADGELLILPQLGTLRLVTELGTLTVGPAELATIPRGVKFRVELMEESSRGYVCENYGAPFRLPDPGLIGVDAMAMPRDFLYPVAGYDAADRPTRLVFKHDGRLLETHLPHSPFDVVAWHGNFAPYKYDLRNFCPVGPLLFDHPPPSIWTLLTSPSDTPGTANVDFVLFRERWAVQEDTFRPPWYHSNVMSELMGLIEGTYDAKLEGFLPGGVSIHNAFLPHGPDIDAFEAGISADLSPRRMPDMLAFMFESRYAWIPTAWAAGLPELQDTYEAGWSDLDDRSILRRGSDG